MATVSNVHLTIGKGKAGKRVEVTVSYRICFSSCELLAGSVFKETVTLMGDDPVWDDTLITIRNGCVKAEKNCVERKFSRQVSRSTLDEDGDTVIFGIPIHAAQDEIYAHVTVAPFMPNGSTGNSNIVTGQFGVAGPG